MRVYNLNNKEIRLFMKKMFQSFEEDKKKNNQLVEKDYYLNFIKNFINSLNEKEFLNLCILYFKDFHSYKKSDLTFFAFLDEELNNYKNLRSFFINLLQDKILSLLKTNYIYNYKREVLWMK